MFSDSDESMDNFARFDKTKRPSVSTAGWWFKQLDLRAFLVFQRMQRFYSTFVVLAALVSGLSVGALTFPEFHDERGRGSSHAGEGFLCSSAMTGIMAAVTATILLFLFEGIEHATRMELAVAWLPLALLDISIVEFLAGMVCWYYEKNQDWRGALMLGQLMLLLVISIALSTWTWFHMSRKGGLGSEERQLNGIHRREANP